MTLTAGARLPRLRAGLRARRAARSRASTRSTAGRVVSTAASTSPPADYMDALRRGARRRGPTRCTRSAPSGGTYLVGPLARFATSFDRADAAGARGGRARSVSRPPSATRSAASSCAPSRLVHAVDEALRLIAAYEEPDAPAIEVEPRAGVGHGVSEAPRGLLYHRYEIDEDGHDPRRRRSCRRPRRTRPRSRTTCAASSSARSTCPTPSCSVRCEQTIRNYDPCISCATHFLKLEIERVLRLIGVGNRWRGDDAAGRPSPRGSRRAAARGRRRRARGRADRADRACEGAGEVWIVDAVSSGAPVIPRNTVSTLLAPHGKLPVAQTQTIQTITRMQIMTTDLVTATTINSTLHT